MGWCPNTGVLKTRNYVQFNNISPGISGGVSGAIKSIVEQSTFKKAVMIVGIYAVLNAFGVYLTAKRNSEKEFFMSIDWTTSFVGALIAFFLLWLIVSGILHILSKVLGGKGKFYPRMMTIVGYSSIPLILESLISLALLFMLEPMTITLSPGNPINYRELYSNHYILFSIPITIIMYALSSIILFFGIQTIHRLTPIKSAIVAGLPLALKFISIARIFRSFIL